MSALSTPLTPWHIEHGAKMAPFAGWNMPIQYTGIIQEHEHTRKEASIFDICHMGELIVSGPGAGEALMKALTSNLSSLAAGRCRYGFLLNEAGGIMDDMVTYRLEENKYMVVVNAACIAQDLAVLRERLPRSVQIEDISARTGKIDLQGPRSLEALTALMPGDWQSIPYFGFREAAFADEKILVSRTGYTGELGYELYVPAEKTLQMWELLLSSPLVKPAGLGARDTLRLESGLPLNGQDLSPERTPAEAGYAAMLTSEADYVGKDGAKDVRRVLTALSIPGRRSARHGNKVLTLEGTEAGEVTSGSFAPSLGYAVALAYIAKDLSGQDKYIIQADRAQLEAAHVTLPFYKYGTARKKLL